MLSWNRLRSISTLLFSLAMVPPLLAQINTGRISGVITDSANSAVPGSNIRAINQDTGVVTSGESNSVGDYLLNF